MTELREIEGSIKGSTIANYGLIILGALTLFCGIMLSNALISAVFYILSICCLWFSYTNTIIADCYKEIYNLKKEGKL